MYLASPLGMTPLEFRQDLWHQKTRTPMPPYLYGVVCVILGLAIMVELQTCDIQTDRHMIDSTALAQHDAVKTQRSMHTCIKLLVRCQATV